VALLRALRCALLRAPAPPLAERMGLAAVASEGRALPYGRRCVVENVLAFSVVRRA